MKHETDHQVKQEHVCAVIKTEDNAQCLPPLEPLIPNLLESDTLSDDEGDEGDEGDSTSDECDIPSDDEQNLRVHGIIKNEPPIMKLAAILCKCGMSFESKRFMQKHAWREHIEVTLFCPDCRFGFHSKPGLSAHQKAVHPKIWSCMFCNFCANSRQLLRNHKASMHTNARLCQICGFVADCRFLMMSHIEKMHVETIVCKKCGFFAPTYQKLRNHKTNVHRNSRLCKPCGVRFVTSWALDKHMVYDHGKVHTCKTCGYKTHWERNLNHHRKEMCQKTLGSQQLQFACDQCALRFKTNRALLVHMSHKHCSLECDFCKSTFSTWQLLVNHQTNNHQQHLSFICHLCSTSFANRTLMYLHQEHTHSRKRKVATT